MIGKFRVLIPLGSMQHANAFEPLILLALRETGAIANIPIPLSIDDWPIPCTNAWSQFCPLASSSLMPRDNS
jgi:hypothetical protein